MKKALFTLSLALVFFTLSACSSSLFSFLGNNDAEREERKPPQNDERALKNRIANAKLVIVGEVLSINAAAYYPHTQEADPDWQWAIIKTRGVFKGNPSPSGNELWVLFPASKEGAWKHSPKFQTRQEGVWILGERVYQFTETEVRAAYTALHPADFQPTRAIEHVRQILRVLQFELEPQ